MAVTGPTAGRPAGKLFVLARPARRLLAGAGACACGVLLCAPAPIWGATPIASILRAGQGITITAAANPTMLGLGSGFVDSATLAPPAGGPAPSGTIKFSVYGPTDPACAGPVIFNSTNTVVATPSLSGVFTTPSSALTPPNLGTYRITATYSGDTNYQPVATACGEPANTVVVGARPTVTALSPASGPAGGGETVTVGGTNLTGASTVNFGNLPVAATVVNSTEVLATAPAGSGTVDVTVTTPFGTTPTTPADLFSYGPPAGPPQPIVVPVEVGLTPPVVTTGQASAVTASTAHLTGTIDPAGVASTAYFEYTVRIPGGFSQTRRTPEEPIGGDSASHPVTADVSGLLPRSRYRLRLAARTAGGVTVLGGATEFQTAGDPPPPRPIVGRAFNATPVSGLVYLRLPGPGRPVLPLTEARQLPVGTTLDTRHGVVRLTSATATLGQTASGSFTGGTVRLDQTRAGGGLAVLVFVRASTARKVCAAPAGQAPPATALGRLRATATGRFEVRGRYGATAGGQASWTTTDRCDGLLTAPTRGLVAVDDFRLGRTVGVRAGQTYLARA